MNLSKLFLIMESVQPKITSIPDLINYIRNSKEHLFYIGRIYCTAPLHLQDYLPNFQIITCFDPFNQRFPFIKVPKSIQNASEPHKCIDSQCQRVVLRDPEVVAYMKSKSTLPNVFYMILGDPQSDRLCKLNNFVTWGASIAAHDLIANKVNVIDTLKKINIPYIPNVCGKIKDYQHFKEIINPLNSQKIVVQVHNGASGYGTYFIQSKQDYDQYAADLQNQLEKKIMPLKQLKSFGISAVTGKFGTIIGPLHSQIIGHPKMTTQRGGYCGNQQRRDFFEDQKIQIKIRHEIYDITKRFGDYLYKQGIMRGMFGIDFVVDVQTHQVYFMELNPRMTGSMTTSYQIYQAEGIQFPHILFHCLQYMGVDASFDVQSFNKEWESLRHYENPITHLALKPMNTYEKNLPIRIPAGVWRIQNGEAKYTGRFTYKLKELGKDQFFFLPNHGFAKGNIFMNKKCQDYNRRLTPQAQNIVDKFLDVIAKNNY